MPASPTDEPLLRPEERRLTLFPVRQPALFDRYQQALASFWTAGEDDPPRPGRLEALTADERHFVRTLAFFASADGIVNDNLAERFCVDVQVREAKLFYDLQKTMENIHSEMYSLLIETLVDDAAERDRLFHAVEHVPCVRKKAAWAQRWIDSSDSFAARLVAFAVVEGVFFSASFCAIFWLKQRGILPGVCASNLLIARDEGMHQRFATHLYSRHLVHKLPVAVVHEIVGDAVDHEVEFVRDALPVALINMNADDMTEYVRFVADRLLCELGVPMLFHASNPFPHGHDRGDRTNFFEQRVTDYRK